MAFFADIQAQNNPPELSGISCGTGFSTEAFPFHQVKIKICTNDVDGDSLKFLWFRALYQEPDVLK